jgi:hypothetical protein
MAKSIKKSISKATKKTKKTAKSAVKEVKSEVSKVIDTGTSTIRATIEKLSKERNLQAAHVWKQIKDNKSLSDNQIKAIINSRNFFALLGKLA